MANIVVLGQIGRVFHNTNEQTGKDSITFDVTESVKKSDGTYEKFFYQCTMWGKRGNTIADNFEPGAPIQIIGTTRGISIKTDKNDKEWQKIIVWVNDFNFIPRDFSEDNKKQPARRSTAEEPEEIEF